MSKKIKIHYAWFIMLSCITIAITGIGIINGCAGIFLLPVSKELGVKIGTLSIYLTIQILSMSLFMPLAEKIFQKFDKRIVMTVAFIMQCGGFMSMSLFTSVIQFYIAGVFIGISSSFILFLAVPVLIHAWFQKYVGFVLGISYSFAGLSGALFNPIGTAFILNYGWRTAYLLLGLIGALIVLPFTIFIVRGDPSEKALKPYGVNDNPQAQSLHNIETTGLTAKQTLKTSSFYMAMIAVICLSLISSIIFHFPVFIASIGMAPETAALCVSVLMIGMSFGKILIGFLADKFGIARAFFVIAFFSSIGTLILILNFGGVLITLCGSALVGLSLAGTTVIPPLLTKNLFGQKDFSKIYSYLSIATGLFGALGASLYGIIYDKTGSYMYDIILVMIAIFLASFNIALSIKNAKKFNSLVKIF